MKRRNMLLVVALAAFSLGVAASAFGEDTLRVVSPNGDEVWYSETWNDLKWWDTRTDQQNRPDSVVIMVIVPEPYGIVMGPLTVPNSDYDEEGVYSWYIPAGTKKAACLFRVMDVGGANHDDSDDTFRIEL